MKRFAIVTAFAAASLVVPGSVFAHGQSQGQAGNPTTITSGAGQPGTTAQPKTSEPRQPKGQPSGSDAVFVKQAAEGGLAEVELGKVAAQKGSSDDVKKFGQRMVDDHSKANEQLQQVASSKKISLPTGLSAKDKATLSRLDKLSGAAFDRAYMNTMVRDHTKDVSEFRKEASRGSDPEVKKFAQDTLPTLESHLSEAKKVDSGVGGAKSGAPASKGKKK